MLTSIALTLLRLMTVTDPRVVREHWRGGGDVVELVGATALLAGKLLPKRIRRVLTSSVEAPKTARGQSDTTKTPLLVERPVAESETVQRLSGKRPIDHAFNCVRQLAQRIARYSSSTPSI